MAAPAIFIGQITDRKRRFVLHLFQRETGADIRHPARLGQPADDEVLQGDGVRNDNPQKIVGVAGHKIAFHDLRKARHGCLECIEHRLGLLIERNLNKDADARAKLDRI